MPAPVVDVGKTRLHRELLRVRRPELGVRFKDLLCPFPVLRQSINLQPRLQRFAIDYAVKAAVTAAVPRVWNVRLRHVHQRPSHARIVSLPQDCLCHNELVQNLPYRPRHLQFRWRTCLVFRGLVRK